MTLLDWSAPGSEAKNLTTVATLAESEGRYGREYQEVAQRNSNSNWYPVRVFFGRAELVKESLGEADIEFFYPMRTTEKFTSSGLKFVEEPLVKSLIFVKTGREELRLLKMKLGGTIIPYYDRLTNAPLIVPQRQMEDFMRLCEMKEAGLEYLGNDEPKYHQGDRVRVTEGIFKGFEGHIKRIRHDRKLIVTIEGVAAFATRFIPPSCLEKVEEKK